MSSGLGFVKRSMALPSEVPTLWEEGEEKRTCMELRICQVLSMYYPLSGNKHTGEVSTPATGWEGFKAGFSKITALSPELRFPRTP